MTSTAVLPTVNQTDPRLVVFCAPAAAEVFQSVVHHSQVWAPDPFDVRTIHAEARETFGALLAQATTAAQPSQSRPTHGRILLLQGEGGSGKTHLMRAFRNTAHADGRGYCGYLQMTSAVGNYARYILQNLLDALDQPYHPFPGATSGLMRLSLGLLEAVPGLDSAAREQFREGYVPDPAARVFEYADWVVTDRRFAADDLDLYRALLFLQRDDARIKSRVMMWLRCEDMAPADRQVLGGLAPRAAEEDALRMIVRLGRLMGIVHDAALVLCVDQLEDMQASPDNEALFRRVIATLVAISSMVPNSIVVIGCLADYFTANRRHLSQPQLDRLLRDPEPIQLRGHRNEVEVHALVAQRLRVLYEEQGVPGDHAASTFPFTSMHLRRLVNKRTRDVLNDVRQHQQRCALTYQWQEPNWGNSDGNVEGGDQGRDDGRLVQTVAQQWNDYYTTSRPILSDDEAGQAELLAWAIAACTSESSPGFRFTTRCAARHLEVECHRPNCPPERRFIAVCNRGAQGGGLNRQVTESERLAVGLPGIVVRSTDFPASSKTDTSRHIASLVRQGWRTVVVQNADWRTMHLLRLFLAAHQQEPGLGAWRRDAQPLYQLASLQAILALQDLAPRQLPQPSDRSLTPPPHPDTPPTVVPATAEFVRPNSSTPLTLGVVRGPLGGSVEFAIEVLTRHAAFLGATGSGKTTVALNLIEQLLERGIPAVLLDRKGDLCRYADPAAWEEPLDDTEPRARRQRLRDRIDVRVYTPGNANGRALSLPVLPPGFEGLATAEQEQVAQYAAAALGGMMGYRGRGDESRKVVLGKALEILGRSPGRPLSISALRQLVEERDDALIQAIGGAYRDGVYQKLGEELLTLSINRRALLDSAAEALSIDALLGRDKVAPGGKTALSIISTRFLGDEAAVEFWVAQFLLHLDRWRSRNPAGALQAVFFFDEADQYLPAMRQPATKGPMESLLKRARSAGVGILLATQSPGDLDYKCRDNIGTWVIGRVREETALKKLEPMFQASRISAEDRLPAQETGQFYVVEQGKVISLQASRSVVETRQLPEDEILQLARRN